MFCGGRYTMMEFQHQNNAEPRLSQMVLLCHTCGTVLLTVATQQRGICSTCVDHHPRTGPQRVSRPKLTAKHPNAPRQQRRYPPDWFYEASLDEVMQLIDLITNTIGSPPLSASALDDPRHLRELQLIYASAAEQYFVANTPFGSNRNGLLRWIEQQLRDYRQRFQP
jgi:hypothetical protein